MNIIVSSLFQRLIIIEEPMKFQVGSFSLILLIKQATSRPKPPAPKIAISSFYFNYAH